jgi:hypothetical protein
MSPRSDLRGGAAEADRDVPVADGADASWAPRSRAWSFYTAADVLLLELESSAWMAVPKAFSAFVTAVRYVVSAVRSAVASALSCVCSEARADATAVAQGAWSVLSAIVSVECDVRTAVR